MNYLKTLALVIILCSFWSCNNDNTNNEASSIEIGSYKFSFPTKFSLVPLQGVDSYIGNINGAGISLFFDYGNYTSPIMNLPENEYLVTVDEINGHYRQIVKPINSEEHYTSIHLYKISDLSTSPLGHKSLSMSVTNLTTTEQEMILQVFNTVTIVE